MEYKTIAGNYYTITSKSGCSVTDATGTLSMTVDAGGQLTVQAPSDKLVFDDEQAIVFKANFNHALAALSLLGGGDKLPAEYTRVEFLESTGTQYLDTGISLSNEHVVKAELQMVAAAVVSGACFGSQDEGNKTNYAFSLYELPSNYYYGWFFYGSTSVDVKNEEVPDIDRYSRLRVQIKDRWLSINGKAIKRGNAGAFNAVRTCWLYDRNSDKNPDAFRGRFFSFVVDKGSTLMRLIPALAPNGVPCMFDMVTGKAFKNDGSGQFIAGCTLAQAAQLGRKLPSTGGELTVSLPEGYDANEGVVNSLTEAESKGWVLTIQTYAMQTSAATFALRRLWVRRQEDANGTYVDADGSRWQVEWCVDIVGADPESLGYERFRSVEVAAEYWGLTPYVDPNAEELSTIEA